MENSRKSNEIQENKLVMQHFNENNTLSSVFNFQHSSSSKCSTLCAREALKITKYNHHLPQIVSYNSNCKVQDSLSTLINNKQSFQLSLDEIKQKYTQYKKKLNADKQIKAYYEVQNLMEKDPDAYFSSNYNWYYTGGNLQFQHLFDNDVLFYVRDKQLMAATLQKNSVKRNLLSNITISKDFTDDLYQLDSFHRNLLTLVIARLKNSIHLFNINFYETDKAYTVKTEITSDKPFVSHSINNITGIEYASIDVDHILNIWDYEKEVKKFTYKVSIDPDILDYDYFAQIAYHDNNTIAYINRTDFYVFDTRTNCQSNSVMNYSELLSPWDRFTNISSNKLNNTNLYLSAFKNVIHIDVRYLSVLQKWGHNFNYAPLLSDVNSVYDKNVFCASSSDPKEKLLLYDTNLPDYLPNANRSFDMCLLQKPSIYKQEDILKRLNMGTTGFCVVVDETPGATIFSSNIAGDIFCQKVLQDEPEIINEKQTEIFLKWNDEFLLHSEKESNFSEIRVVDKQTLKRLEFVFDCKTDTNYEKEKMRRRKKLKQIVTDLKTFKKGYNDKITEIWKNMNDTVNLNRVENLPSQKHIIDWLDQSAQVENMLMDIEESV